jgi:hypothetical protein
VDDYLRFARIFLGDGSVDGVRLLRTETLARMMTNQLTETQRTHPGWLGLKPGRGFGLGVSVVLETDHNDFMRRGRGTGSRRVSSKPTVTTRAFFGSYEHDMSRIDWDAIVTKGRCGHARIC